MRFRHEVVSYLNDLWRYARVLARDDNAADDLVQEALTRALGMAHKFDQSRPLLPWLIVVVRNTHLTRMTRDRAERRRDQAYATLVDTNSPPDQEHSAELAQVREAIDTLPGELAEVLHLVGVLGFSYADAAAVLGIPVGTVMSRLSRARAALRAALEERHHERTARLKLVGGRDAQQ